MTDQTSQNNQSKLKFLDDPAFRCLREGDIEGFNRYTADCQEVDFSNCELKGVDFRGADLSKVILRGSHLRDADLRGTDLRHTDMEGCSIIRAKTSGADFPDNISPEEIRLGLEYGTRLRTRS